MAAEETRAEAVAHGQSLDNGNPVAEFVRNSPFLALSLLFHFVVLLLLTFFTAQNPEPPREKIEVPLAELKTPDPERPRPEIEDHPLDENATEQALEGRGGRSGPSKTNSHEEAKKRTAPVDSGPVDAGPMVSTIGPGDPRDLDTIDDDKAFDRVMPRGPSTMNKAVDKFALATINEIADGKTLVVLMIDRSRSIVYDDLPQLTDRMNHYFDEIDKNLPIPLTGQGHWQVLSYGRKAQFKGQPSANMNYIKTALGSVEVDGSGVENVASGVNRVIDRFGDSEYENIVIACMTDECGDDIQNRVVLEQSINRMRKHDVRFFVFGYEAVFAARKKRVSLKLDKELLNNLQGADRASLRGFEGRWLRGWNDAGPAAPRPELWWGENWHHWRRWGATLNGIRSGFGMYALNRMTLRTRGTYFILRKKEEMKHTYDREKMLASYFPDTCSKFIYEKRNKQIPLRKVLQETWKKIARYYLSGHMRTDDAVKKNLRMAEGGRQYCITQARKLHKLINQSESRGRNWERWIAHAELTRAELLRLRFMLGQYHLTLRNSAKKHGYGLRERKKRYIMRRGKIPVDYKGPEQAEKEYHQAQQFIQLCIDKHQGTPWGILAKRMKRKIFPWKATFKDWRKPTPPTRNTNREPIPPGVEHF